MKKIIKRILKLFIPYKKIIFNDLSNINPISNKFGFDRGTPIDRYYIEKFLSENSKYIKGTVLEIAESTYSKKFYSGQRINYEVLHIDKNFKDATIYGDLTMPDGLPEDFADCFICTQTYNYIFDVKSAIEGSYKILKKGGVLLATVSGISQISRYDMERWGDYWRFTDKSLQLLFSNAGFKEIKIVSMGNVIAATAFLQGVVVEDLPNINLLSIVDNDYQLTLGVIAKKI
ncbi:MAG: methyltransferase [Bacteroidales bacterium]|nr:methyltransferase [Bacteroidales bacterium]